MNCRFHCRSAVARRGMDRAIVLGLLAAWLAIGCVPIGPLPGGRLSGSEKPWPGDWSLAAEASEIQLETRPEDPYSVTLWVVVVDGSAFVASSLLAGPEQPAERQWVRNVEADPSIRIRVDGAIYAGRVVLVDDEASRARLQETYRTKYPEIDADADRAGRARFFRLTSPALP